MSTRVIEQSTERTVMRKNQGRSTLCLVMGIEQIQVWLAHTHTNRHMHAYIHTQTKRNQMRHSVLTGR